MHNEEGNARALYQGIKQAMDGMGDSYEILFVNDASTDGTMSVLRNLQTEDPRFHFVDLAENAGENWALLAGVSKAQGEIIISIDGDNQNDPAYIPDLIGELRRGFRVVSGRRKQRCAQFWAKRLPSGIANGMIRIVSGVPVHDCGCGLKAYRREVLADRFVPDGTMNRFSPVALGVRRSEFSEVDVIDRPRIAGKSHYGLKRIYFVLRDLWALPFAVRGAARWQKHFYRVFGAFSAGALLLGRFGSWKVAAALTLGAGLSFANVVTLERFVRAQSLPGFRIKEFK
jgi:glycosyltransferase involved in cell wall biosynthesis